MGMTVDGDDSGQRREGVIYQYEYKQDEERCTYLVIAEDEVLAVVRKVYEGSTTGFIIFKVDQGEGDNITVHPLQSLNAGFAMFVGLNHSFVLSATEFPELKPNFIYFTDPFDLRFNIYDNGIFDYQSRIFYPCYSPQQHNHGNADAEENNEEEDNDGGDEERILRLVWFRPSSQV